MSQQNAGARTLSGKLPKLDRELSPTTAQVSPAALFSASTGVRQTEKRVFRSGMIVAPSLFGEGRLEMFIHEMREFECEKVLEQASVGRLACAKDNQPYVVPVYFSYNGRHIYGFTTLGQKAEWMRTNSKVCLEIDERKSYDRWMSVIVFGRYEELPDEPEFEAARVAAYEVLQKRAMWWEPAYAEHSDVPHSLTPIFYRIHIEHISGRRATPDEGDGISESVEKPKDERTWFGKILQHLHLIDKGSPIQR